MHELGHTLEFNNPNLLKESAAFLSVHTDGPIVCLMDGAQPGYDLHPLEVSDRSTRGTSTSS